MIVHLQDPPNLTCPHHRLDRAMTTQLSPPTALFFDARTQIIDNCEFLMRKDDIVQVVTSKDPEGDLFKAYAVKLNGKERQVILVSKPCENVEKAVECLHTRSCEAVHNHVTAKGVPGSRGPKTEPGADDADNVSVVSDHSDLSVADFSEGCSSVDDDETLRHFPITESVTKAEQRASFYPAANAYPRRPSGPPGLTAAARDLSDYVKPASHGGPPPGSRPHPSTFGQAIPPPLPPPPGYPYANNQLPPLFTQANAAVPAPHPGPPGLMPPRHAQNCINPPMPPPQPYHPFRGAVPDTQPPFAVRQTAAPKPPQAQLVRITVNWLRHGQHRIVTQCAPTREALQAAALGDVRANRGAFAAARGGGGELALRAHVRQAVFSGETYDMRAFAASDLSRLFVAMAAADDVPLFEVVVEDGDDGAVDAWVGRRWG
ncbi:hypothetical protein F4861DRAFT_73534 [Xylaria intraflava]|nr:hypothetical protein F4861DRAFT_73534 [Xylaria intraflava]